MKLTAGTKVGQGYYWNVGRWEIANIGPQGGTLPGADGDRFVKVPLVAALLAAPLFGLVFVMFLPFIGVAMLAGLVAKKVGVMLHGGATSVAATVAQSSALPGETYLTGTRDAAKPGDQPHTDAEVEKLTQEVSDRRTDKK